VAAATLVQQQNEAKEKQSIGLAEAEAEKAKQLASVTAQTTLVKEVGENKEYQQYLVTVEQIKASRDVGIEQAKNIGNAKIEILANAGNVESGLGKVTDLFTSKGTAALNGLFAGLGQTEAGKALIEKFTDKSETKEE
jgi:flotillin